MGARVRCDEARLLALVADGLTNEQIASTIGVTDRTLTRWRVARPSLSAEINRIRGEMRTAALFPCGTSASYLRGCKCAACRAANAAEHLRRARLARSRPLPEGVEHGRASTYNWYGCRCAPCTHASTVYNRPYNRTYCARRRAARAAS